MRVNIIHNMFNCFIGELAPEETAKFAENALGSFIKHQEVGK